MSRFGEVAASADDELRDRFEPFDLEPLVLLRELCRTALGGGKISISGSGLPNGFAGGFRSPPARGTFGGGVGTVE